MLHHLRSSRTNLPPVFLLLWKKTSELFRLHPGLSFNVLQKFFILEEHLWQTVFFPQNLNDTRSWFHPLGVWSYQPFYWNFSLPFLEKNSRKNICVFLQNMLVTWLKNQHRHFHGRMSTFATAPLHCSASFHVKRWEKKWPFRGSSPFGKEGLSWVFKSSKS